jgi:hypothetical protein
MRPVVRFIPVAVVLLACQALSFGQSKGSQATETLTPKNTPKPGASGLPDVVNQTVSGASVKYQDNFDSYRGGSAPKGWESCEDSTIWGSQNGALGITTNTNWGTVYYYSAETIKAKEGVYFLFQIKGPEGGISFGIDNNGDEPLCNGNSSSTYYSVAMNLEDSGLNAHSIKNGVQDNNYYFEGNFTTLEESVWYGIALGFDGNDTYFITIWKRSDPSQKITFHHAYSNFPKSYNFIGYMWTDRSLQLADFTIFTFDSIQETNG